MSLGILVLFLPFVLGPVVPPVPVAPPPSIQPTPESTLAPDVVPAVEDYNRYLKDCDLYPLRIYWKQFQNKG